MINFFLHPLHPFPLPTTTHFCFFCLKTTRLCLSHIDVRRHPRREADVYSLLFFPFFVPCLFLCLTWRSDASWLWRSGLGFLAGFGLYIFSSLPSYLVSFLIPDRPFGGLCVICTLCTRVKEVVLVSKRRDLSISYLAQSKAVVSSDMLYSMFVGGLTVECVMQSTMCLNAVFYSLKHFVHDREG